MTLAAVALLATAAQAGYSQNTKGCNAAASEPIVTLPVPGTPFQALPSDDGCWIFVSLPAAGAAGVRSQLALVRRGDGQLRIERAIEIGGNANGMAVTHDGRMLIVASGARIAFVDVPRLISGRGNPIMGYLDDPSIPRLGRIYASVTSDDRFAFVADENALTISVLDLEKARGSRFSLSSIVGRIPTGTLPIAVTLSADNKYMYATSQWAPADYHWPIECKREGVNATDTTAVNPQGAIHIVDVARAKTDAAHSIVGSVPAGCSAVRLVLSPTGDRAYVTARNSNALMVFDTQKLRSDPDHALIGRVPVGTSPVGIAVADSGRKVIVTNSNRFGGSGDDHQVLTVVDAAKVAQGAAAVLGTIPAGAFPREMRVTADGKTLILTNFGSKTIEMIDLARIP